jgi:hypothetical protein
VLLSGPEADRGRPASGPGAAARAEAGPMGRSAAPRLVTATRRSPQPPPRPPSERRPAFLTLRRMLLGAGLYGAVRARAAAGAAEYAGPGRAVTGGVR